MSKCLRYISVFVLAIGLILSISNDSRAAGFFPPGPFTCPSIIGGSGAANQEEARFLPYFFSASVSPAEGEIRMQQSVETDGSLSGLNVFIQNPDENPGEFTGWTIDVRVNKDDTINCEIMEGEGECVSGAKECIDVKAGDFINVKITPISTPMSTVFNHTVVFNGCQCCDGKPPPCDDG